MMNKWRLSAPQYVYVCLCVVSPTAPRMVNKSLAMHTHVHGGRATGKSLAIKRFEEMMNREFPNIHIFKPKITGKTKPAVTGIFHRIWADRPRWVKWDKVSKTWIEEVRL